MSKNEFSSRWGVVLASLGMAIGAGNLWRFPRLAGQYGGAFIILWMLFLLVWSIPLLMSEFAIGKAFRKSVIGSFGKLGGAKSTWMGFFVTICTLGIAFYYTVVVVWSISYLKWSILESQTLTRTITNLDILKSQWQTVSSGSLESVFMLIMVVVVAILILSRGIKKGLELANKVLVPSLFILLIFIAYSALNLPNGAEGFRYMFHIDWELFVHPKVWIEALSQSAWSTGAGWGLLMTISSYTRQKEEVTFNVIMGAVGNNLASVMAGLAILPAVFGLSVSNESAIEYLQSGSQALAFTIIPQLFATISGGSLLMIIFFLALTLAAFTSLLAMFELMSKHLEDAGLTGNVRWVLIAIVFILFGIPSAYSLDFFNNQDWVWGIGLVVSGLFIAILVLKNNPEQFKSQLIDPDSDFVLPTWFFKYSLILVVILAPVLIVWWMSQGYSANPWFDESGWNWFDTYSNASIATQWGVVIIIGLVLRSWLYKKFVG
ncbi:sodium-dependent transporter [Reichenbachiella versicolor]|uniref:sodium-dependent transporter n=1 Tax=Reichenbachiella versicolor TaxID=1821036 RepID=UPI000D6DF738|nr:sodium-dependent transporter [Reichenbachiella versicolor]